MFIVLLWVTSPELDLITRSDRRLNSGTTGVRSPWNFGSRLTVGAAPFGSIVVTVELHSQPGAVTQRSEGVLGRLRF